MRALGDITAPCSAKRLQREWEWGRRMEYFKEDDALRCVMYMYIYTYIYIYMDVCM